MVAVQKKKKEKGGPVVVPIPDCKTIDELSLHSLKRTHQVFLANKEHLHLADALVDPPR